MLERREGRLRPAVERWRAAIEAVCGRLNPILLVVVIGLLILDVGGYAALELGRWRPPQPGWAPQAAGYPAMTRNLSTQVP